MKHKINGQRYSGNPYAESIQAALRAQGRSLRRWALARGYPVTSVYVAVQTWAGRVDRHPQGGQSRQILAELRADLGADLVPEMPQQEAA